MGLASCSSFEKEADIPLPTELTNFETIISYDEVILANPQRLRFDSNQDLIVFDSDLEKVLRVPLDRKITPQDIGRKGNGPGEYQFVSNIFLVDGSIYLIDDRQFTIHQFSQTGSPISSMVYGDFGTHRINKPTVVNNRDLLIPTPEADQSLFTLMNRSGEELTQFGHIPESSVDELDYDDYRLAVSNRTVPDYFKPHVFAINAGESSVFIIYESFPKISSYDLSGELHWETEPIDLPEIDSVTTKYYDFMDMILRQTNAVQPLKKYVDGVSKNGRLFVSTNTSHDNPLWIHEFDGNGILANRFVLKSDVGLKSYFDIDINEKKIFVLTEEGEIRAYHY